MPETDIVRYVLDRIGDQIARQRRAGAAVERCAVCFSVAEQEAVRELTLVVGDEVVVLAGDIASPGLPHAKLRLTHADLLGLLRGKVEARALLARARLGVEGRADLLASLAACFPKGKSWLSVRL